jgi:energy-coupling factor transporter ATP-binding protein EcfA2
MLRSLQIEQFRSFGSFEVPRLGRVNLLVGSNNSGKTSLLEAIELLLAHGDPRSIWTALNRRGERVWEDEDRRGSPELDICRLFYGHTMKIGSSFHINANNDVNAQSLTAELVELDEETWKQAELPAFEQESQFTSAGLSLRWLGEHSKEEFSAMPITDRGGLSLDLLRRRPMRIEGQRQPVAFVTTSSLTSDEVVFLLSRVILNPEEDLLLRALRIIEPDIERIAPVASSRNAPAFGHNSSRGGVVIKSSGLEKRLPIGTMGDGIWRLLALALSLVRAQDGVLLVDEVDTGLHYTVMEDMWRLMNETALRLNVQVFATTHSSDCWRALAAICRPDMVADSDVTIQHIERGAKIANQFNERDISIAARRGLEVR